MKRKNFEGYVRYLSLITLLVFGCYDAKRAIIGKWTIYQVENINESEFISIPIRDSSPYVEFNSDKSFEGQNDLGMQSGTWSFENNSDYKRIMISQQQDTFMLYIEKLNNENLIWRFEEDKLRLRFYCKRIK